MGAPAGLLDVSVPARPRQAEQLDPREAAPSRPSTGGANHRSNPEGDVQHAAGHSGRPQVGHAARNDAVSAKREFCFLSEADILVTFSCSFLSRIMSNPRPRLDPHRLFTLIRPAHPRTSAGIHISVSLRCSFQEMRAQIPPMDRPPALGFLSAGKQSCCCHQRRRDGQECVPGSTETERRLQSGPQIPLQGTRTRANRKDELHPERRTGHPDRVPKVKSAARPDVFKKEKR